MIGIIDYGAGNIQSVVKALKYIGCSCVVTDSPERIERASAVILPGVGAFGDAVGNMKDKGLDKAIQKFIRSGRPFLGICLGMQVLFDSSEESPGEAGLGILQGKIIKIPKAAKSLKIPHIGWNSLKFSNECRLYSGIEPEPYVYFVHSYYLQTAESIVTAETSYGVNIQASVQRRNVYAVQFHPEKSGETGINMLRNFKNICEGEKSNAC